MRCERVVGVIVGIVFGVQALLGLSVIDVFGFAKPARAAPVESLRLVLPVEGAVVRGFDPPSTRWGAGHRGVDLVAAPGTFVVAAADGVITHASNIAGRNTVSVTHDGPTRLRTTYEPVTATVPVGAKVSAGQVIGVVDSPAGGSSHVGLHWGLLRGGQYLNPLDFVDGAVAHKPVGPIRLLPAGWEPTVSDEAVLDIAIDIILGGGLGFDDQPTRGG